MADLEVEAVNFEPEEDDLMDEDNAADIDAAAPMPRLKSAIIGSAMRTKGRGFRTETDEERTIRMSGRFDSLDSDGGPGPERCQLFFFILILVFIYLFIYLYVCVILLLFILI